MKLIKKNILPLKINFFFKKMKAISTPRRLQRWSISMPYEKCRKYFNVYQITYFDTYTCNGRKSPVLTSQQYVRVEWFCHLHLWSVAKTPFFMCRHRRCMPTLTKKKKKSVEWALRTTLSRHFKKVQATNFVDAFWGYADAQQRSFFLK